MTRMINSIFAFMILHPMLVALGGMIVQAILIRYVVKDWSNTRYENKPR